MLLVSPVALLTRPRIPVSVCFPTGISSCAWLSFLLHMKIPINGMLAITLSLNELALDVRRRHDHLLGLVGELPALKHDHGLAVVLRGIDVQASGEQDGRIHGRPQN